MKVECRQIIGLTILVCVAGINGRNVFELYLDCPHAVQFGETTLHGSITLPPIPIADAVALEVESSCSMDVHSSLRASTELTQITWAKKNDHTGAAAATSFEATSVQKSMKGLCILTHKVIEQAYKSRKSVICYDLICNQTACKPELHYMSPIHACNMMKSCIVGVGPFRVQIIFKRTYCTVGILIEGKCFRPDRSLINSIKPGLLESATLNIHCFLIAKTDEKLKLVEEIEKFKTTNGCTTNEQKFQGYYICLFGGSSEVFRLPNPDDSRSKHLFQSIYLSPHGEDHDNIGEEYGNVRIAGPIEIKIPHTESTANVKAIAFTGTPMYSSLSAYPKDVSPKYAFHPGLILNYNQSECSKKGLPIVWTGLIEMPGTYEPINKCNVFCVLSGPGASCEAFAEGGIFNISSPTCLVSKHTTFKTSDQQITFVCQRIDTDIIVYCNGYKKIILTKTLIIGQCIYTVTSIFSIFSSVAHSIAVELCVPGFHGWTTMILIITFCFGWLLIPIITWLILIILKFIASILHSQSEENRFKTLLRKIKEEYERTKGSMVCDICKVECETQMEYKAHGVSCPQNQCPYCFAACEPSESAFQAHYKACQVTHRFSDELRKTISMKPKNQGCYRTLNLFRYRSRCYIFTVWILLLTIESIFWAVSAEPEPLVPTWNDNAHGIGRITLNNDLELDFSLTSSSKYTYRRLLINPRDDNQRATIHLEIYPQVITAEVQNLGHWFDAQLNIKTIFHCYGECSKYSYPWQTASCKFEKDYQYESGWGCNPIDCPGVGTGCTACGLYLDKFRSVGTAYKIVSIRYTRRICVQFNEETNCKVLDSNDCFITRNFKICMVGTVSKFTQGDTLLFLGPMEGGGLILKQWCTTSCQYGDPGDIMKLYERGFQCPDYPGTFWKRCMFAHTPVCEYQGNTMSGYKKLMATIDSFQSFNTTDIHYTKNRLEWSDPDGLLRDHINVLVSREVEFTDLSDNPCRLNVQTINIEGSWGSGVGFTLKCVVSLTECPSFITSIKACDAAICYGAKSVTLSRGQNVVLVVGKGGHSGSKFRCCHDEVCSSDGLLASSPHLERVTAVDAILDNHIYDDGAPKCRFKCWFHKTGEWLWGLFQGNWMVVVVLVALLIISLICLSFLCPVRKLKRG
ncbi:envelope glycoprotein [Asama virus]|uniref:Envelopment polyprotein n=1 Tax=Asama virus TaxID=564878 RepID=B6DDK6_9VIRU|nr:envelope glycoprotein [Asama virus]ACI28508.1 envelope glycoprotein [Asama virus]